MPRALLPAAVLAAAVAAAACPAAPATASRPAGGRPLAATFVLAAPTGAPIEPALPANPSNRLDVEGGGLDLPVGVYSDCTRATEVGHDGAYVDACIPRPVAYFIGHNPGPFTPMAGVAVGQVVDYYDGSGALHRLQIVSARQWNRFWGPPPPTQTGVVAQFQTCITLDAVWDRILDAVEIPAPPLPAPVVPMLGEARTA